MTIERQHEERCPLWCRFFVCHATNFAPCATCVVRQTMPAALKSVVEVRCAMNSAQNTTGNVQGTVVDARGSMHWTQWSEGKTTLHKNAFIRDVAFFNILLFYYHSSYNVLVQQANVLAHTEIHISLFCQVHYIEAFLLWLGILRSYKAL